MPLPDLAERRLVGPLAVVEFAVKSDEQMAEGWFFWGGVEEDRKGVFARLMQQLCDEGKLVNPKRFKTLKGCDGLVCEFKEAGDRLLCYRPQLGNRYIITNGLKKSGRSKIEDDIMRAIRIGERHLKWEASQR